MLRSFIISIIALVYWGLDAQQITSHTIEELKQHLTDLAPEDLSDWRVSSQFSQNGFQYYYLQQRKDGFDIENAILSLVLDNQGKILVANHSFVSDLTTKLSHANDQINYHLALEQAVGHLGLSSSKSELIHAVDTRNEDGNHQRIFSPGEASRQNIPVEKLWVKTEKGYILAYKVEIYSREALHYWNIFVSAESGEILKKYDSVLRCNFDDSGKHDHLHEHQNYEDENILGHMMQNEESYNVYPLFVENPGKGDREIVISPADPEASPFGWHDSDGNPGPEFSDTRGNNAFVQEDFNFNNSGGKRAEGGEDLVFNFDVNFASGPKSYVDASLTNLFYWVNLNHDIFYHYGFDEASGNFQLNNYGRGGLEFDQVYADAQDGSGQNNATFLTLEDGISPRMEMFVWGTSRAILEISGDSRAAGIWRGPESAFQGGINTLRRQGPQEGRIILVEDDQSNTNLACSVNPISNPDEINGAIALIDRGDCLFTEKVLNAQLAGAVACIICNNENGTINMGGSNSQVTIPAMMLNRTDCNVIKRALLTDTLHATMSGSGEGDNLDSSFDNMIITHEFGHGISNRLTGGKDVTSCLNNTEQMGEGWSDYFGLMLTTDWESASPEDRRPLGNWLLQLDNNEPGIRPFPYSYSKGINPMSYSDISRFSVPHGVGAVWCSMLWDMTWEIINFLDGHTSTDIYFGDGGNNIALRLVMEGLKLQTCNPGFVDGRDAILQADQLLYNGEHQFAIWKAFARRGLGANANQNSSFSVSDGQSSSELPPEYISKAENFMARDSSQVITMSWTSVREIDNKAFRILRSTDNKLFRVIAELPGKRFSNDPRKVTYIDQDVRAGRWYYYKLETQDESLRTRVQGLDSAIIIETENIAVFPNPSSGKFHLAIDRNISEKVTFVLYNAQGQQLEELTFEDPSILHNVYRMDWSHLPRGAYFLSMNSGENQYIRRLIIR